MLNKKNYDVAVSFLNKYVKPEESKVTKKEKQKFIADFEKLSLIQKDIVRYIIKEYSENKKNYIKELDLKTGEVMNLIYKEYFNIPNLEEIPDITKWEYKPTLDTSDKWAYYGNIDSITNPYYNIQNTPYYTKIKINAIISEDTTKIYEVIRPILEQLEDNLYYKMPKTNGDTKVIEDLTNLNKGNFITIYPSSKEQLYQLTKDLNKAINTLDLDSINQYCLDTDIITGDSKIITLIMDKDENGGIIYQEATDKNIAYIKDRHDIYFKLLNEAREQHLLTDVSEALNAENMEQLHFIPREQKQTLTMEDEQIIQTIIDYINNNEKILNSKKELVKISNEYILSDEVKIEILNNIDIEQVSIPPDGKDSIRKNKVSFTSIGDILEIDKSKLYEKYFDYLKDLDNLSETQDSTAKNYKNIVALLKEEEYDKTRIPDEIDKFMKKPSIVIIRPENDRIQILKDIATINPTLIEDFIESVELSTKHGRFSRYKYSEEHIDELKDFVKDLKKEADIEL